MTKIFSILLLTITIAVTGCQTTKQAMLDESQSSPELRAMQTRSYEAKNKEEIMRAVIQTLQDLNFQVHNVNGSVGLISATKQGVLVNTNVIEKSKGQFNVRMNANFMNKPVTDPIHYTNFFNALSKSVFLENNI